MNRSTNYRTRQREAILRYILSLNGAHVTAAQIAEHFEKEELPVGRATIYRYLDKLTETGTLRRYTTDGVSGACFQYIGDGAHCQAHLHLKCERCGDLQHLECEALQGIQQHILSQHAFAVNALKTVLYGTCDHCLHKT